MADVNQKRRKANRKGGKSKPPLSFATSAEMVPLDRVDWNPWQPRESLVEEVVKERADSIEANGLLVNPTGRAVDGRVQIADGAYRVAAFRLLAAEDERYKEIPIELKAYTDLQMALIGLEANRQRKDLSPIEEARGFKRVIEEFPELNYAALGKSVGLSKSAIGHAINALDLPEEVLKRAEQMGMALSCLREFRCLRGQLHAHEKAITFVMNRMERSGAVTVEALRRVLGEILQYGYIEPASGMKDFRALNGEHYPRPEFDTDAFAAEHGEQVHTLPGKGRWTCALKAWNEWQEKAMKERERERRDQVLYHPVGEVATDVLPELARPVPDEEAQVAELQEAEAEADREEEAVDDRQRPDDAAEEERAESVHTEQAKAAEPEIRITLGEMVPLPATEPTAGKALMPEGFDFEAQQDALKDLLDLQAEGKEPAELWAEHADLVNSALGFRAFVYAIGSLGYGQRNYLTEGILETLKDPEECLTRCAWGLSHMVGYTRDEAGVRELDRLCVNEACFKAKARQLKKERTAAGKAGFDRETEILEYAARAMLERETVNLGRGECLTLLATLTEGHIYVGSRHMAWWQPLLPRLGIDANATHHEVRQQAWEVLKERDDVELRYFVAVMMLERLRSHGTPAEWEERLQPWLELLGNPGADQVQEVEVARPVKEKRQRRAKK